MQISPRQFPHPVLSHFSDDLTDCEYQCTVKVASTSATYDFYVTAVTSSPDLKKLLDASKASHAIHLDCAKTRYRGVFKSNQKKFSFQVESKLLEGKVEISRFIVANEQIDGYTNNNFHPDYEGNKFDIKCGDILALNETLVFQADKDIDPLKNIPSIFSIKVSKAEDAPPIDITLDTKIYIYLSEENYRKFGVIRIDPGFRPVLVQMVLVPALTHALDRIKAATEEERLGYEEMRWYKILAKKLKEYGVDLANKVWSDDSTIVLAQKLIGEPISSSLEALESVMQGD